MRGKKGIKNEETQGGASRSQIHTSSAPSSERPNIPPTPNTPLPAEIPSYTPYDFKNCITRQNHDGPYFLPDVVAAIRVTDGNFLEMSALLGRRRNSVRDYVYAIPQAKEVLDEVKEEVLDRIEQALQEVGLGGRDPATLRFLASTLGKGRGYTPRIEHTGKDDRPFQFEVVLSDRAGAHQLTELDKQQQIEKELDDILILGKPLTSVPS